MELDFQISTLSTHTDPQFMAKSQIVGCLGFDLYFCMEENVQYNKLLMDMQKRSITWLKEGHSLVGEHDGLWIAHLHSFSQFVNDITWPIKGVELFRKCYCMPFGKSCCCLSLQHDIILADYISLIYSLLLTISFIVVVLLLINWNID